MSVKVAFAIGAFVFLTSVLFTILTTSEYPPEDMEAFEKEKAQKSRFVKDIIENIGKMPLTMKQLGVILVIQSMHLHEDTKPSDDKI